LDQWRALDDSRMIAHSLANLGETTHQLGDLTQAERMFQESLSLFRELGDKLGSAFTLYHLGKLALRRDDAAEASARFKESLSLRRDVGDTSAVIESLEGLAETAGALGNVALGVRLFGAADALRLATGAPLPVSLSGEFRSKFLAAARGNLGEGAFNHEWAQGEKLSIDQAVAEATTAVYGPTLIGLRAR
jgi:tetratricopeptide (TPR) repeat protein